MPQNEKTNYEDQSSFPFSRILLCGLLPVSLLLGACSDTQPTDGNKTPVISGQPNTAFPMPPIKPLGSMGWELGDGKRSRFSEYKGKVLILDFYATWCEPCRASVPHLVQVQERYGNQGLQIVGLNVGGPDDLKYVSEFASEFKIQYPLAVPDDQLSRFLLGDDLSIPQTFVFDRQGQLVKRFIGYSEETASQIDQAINTALKPPADGKSE